MADRIFLSNDTSSNATGGTSQDEEVFHFFFANESSAHTNSAVTLLPLAGPMKANGRVVEFSIAVAKNAVSASGFVSCMISADLRLNSASILTTVPAIVAVAGSAGQVSSQPTNAGGGTSAVIGSGNFSTGDRFAVNYQTVSGGSAAATAAGTGLYVSMRVRYAAI